MMDAILTLAGGVKTASVSAKTDARSAEDPSVASPPTESAKATERSGRNLRQLSEEANREARDQTFPAELKQAVESINGFLQNQKRALEFSVDDETGYVVITVMDVDRKEVIRQIPSEQALKLMAQVREGGGLRGTLSEKA